MSYAARKRRLVSAERRIRQYFLNFSPRITGNYTPRQLRHAESYVIHLHAEIESYFEDMVAFTLDSAEQKWVSNRIPTLPLLYLASFYNEKIDGLSSVPTDDIWQQRARQAISMHRQKVQRNHGIRSKNIVSLYAPVGFDVRSIDSILLSELDSFGFLRGGYAHSSMHTRAGATFDPFLFPLQAQRLINLIDPFDQSLCAFIEAI